MCIMQAILVEEGVAFDNNSVSLVLSFPRALVLVRLGRLGRYRHGTAAHAVSADISLRHGLLSVQGAARELLRERGRRPKQRKLPRKLLHPHSALQRIVYRRAPLQENS
jgi:hypothetical protein